MTAFRPGRAVDGAVRVWPVPYRSDYGGSRTRTDMAIDDDGSRFERGIDR